MIVVSTIARRLGVFPRWLVAAGYVAAVVLLLNVSYLEPLVLVPGLGRCGQRRHPHRAHGRERVIRA
jgi:hypothetical protein